MGGTKTLVAVGQGLDDLADHWTFPTTEPKETMDTVVDHLAGSGVGAVGVASFGPVETRPGRRWSGCITNTPKAGWSFTPVAPTLAERLGVAVALDTDVNGSALGEGEWGAAMGLDVYAYVTVGTGIGGGVVIDGSPLHGAPHPELGHVVVQRHPDDDHPGSCPFHGDCLEGMASGPSLLARFGRRAEDLDEAGRARAVELVSHYLGQGLRNLVYAVAPERIVLGGGVSKLEGLHSSVLGALRRSLSGYPGDESHQGDDFVVAPRLGALSGLAGALLLARRAGPDDR